MACSKLDWDTLKDLVQIGGDPLLPDKDGNTFLHTLCTGHVVDQEYDFVKFACYEFEMKLTRNSQGKSPLNLIRSMEANFGNIRIGQPNYKRKLQDFFEAKLREDPTFEDHESNSEFHLAIIRNHEEKFMELIESANFAKFLLNHRNSEGQSPVYLIIKLKRDKMFEILYDRFRDIIDWRSKEQIRG